MRHRYVRIHHVVGRTYVTSVLLVGTAAFTMSFFGTVAFSGFFGFGTLAAIWVLVTLKAYRSIRRGELNVIYLRDTSGLVIRSSSIGEAVAAAHVREEPSATAMLDTARAAFVTGFRLVAATGAALLLVAVVIVLLTRPTAERADSPRTDRGPTSRT